MTWDAIFSLQGHGPYILGAYGVTAVLMGVEVMLLWRRARVRRDRRAGADRPGVDRPGMDRPDTVRPDEDRP